MASNSGLLDRAKNLVSARNRQQANAADSVGALRAAGAFPGGFRPVMTNSKVKTYPVVKHYQGLPTSHVIRFKSGKRVASGPALSFWFRELNTSIVEVPKDDQELPFLFQVRSQDFQDVTVQGIITYRITNAETAASRIDFSIDVETGNWRVDPKVKIESLLTQIAQASSVSYISATNLETILDGDTIDLLTSVIQDAFAGDPVVSGTGIEIASVTVTSVKPRADVEKALQVPTFERLQEKADEATFDRRAKAVEKERTIQQNELDTQLELNRKRETLLDQERVNTLKQTETQVETQRINNEASAERTKLLAEATAESTRLTEQAHIEAERARMDLVRDLDPQVLIALALQKLAENPPENLRTVVFGDGMPQLRTNIDQD